MLLFSVVTELHWNVAVSIETAAEISDRYSTITPEIYQRANKNTEMLFFGQLVNLLSSNLANYQWYP